MNKSFGFFVNSSVPAACDSYPKQCDHGSWNMLGDTNYPDMFMDGVGRHQARGGGKSAAGMDMCFRLV